jgi:hypothetical protein
MQIEWKGPFGLLPGTLEPNGLPEAEGVYLWVLPHEGRRLVHYIGYAGNIRRRQYDHIVRALGGGDWVPTYPVREKIENRYKPPAQSGSWNVSFDRLRQYVEALPRSVEEILAYLKSVEIFAHITPKARDLEYLLQQHFIKLATCNDSRAALCYEMSLRGSRRLDRDFKPDGHAFPEGVTIAGLSDPD